MTIIMMMDKKNKNKDVQGENKGEEEGKEEKE